jgi:hypothetical protein
MRVFRFAAWLTRSTKVWALALVLAALAAVLMFPKEAPASCYPCGGLYCIDPNNGACAVSVGGTVCVHGSLYRCWVSNGCPTLTLSGYC